MNHSKAFALIFTIVIFLATPNLLTAGPYTDELAKCLVRSTSETDQSNLIKWIFAAFSHHPDVKVLANITDKEKDDLNKTIAELFIKLMTETCRKETKIAYKFEGKSTIEASFSVLGSVAARGLMSHLGVSKYTSDLEKYVDGKKLQEVLGSQ